MKRLFTNNKGYIQSWGDVIKGLLVGLIIGLLIGFLVFKGIIPTPLAPPVA